MCNARQFTAVNVQCQAMQQGGVKACRQMGGCALHSTATETTTTHMTPPGRSAFSRTAAYQLRRCHPQGKRGRCCSGQKELWQVLKRNRYPQWLGESVCQDEHLHQTCAPEDCFSVLPQSRTSETPTSDSRTECPSHLSNSVSSLGDPELNTSCSKNSLSLLSGGVRHEMAWQCWVNWKEQNKKKFFGARNREKQSCRDFL